MSWNLPIWLTLCRFIMTPFFILVFYLPFTWAPIGCILIFILAAITDWIDGFLARRWKQTTNFGAFLDPIADKFIVSAALLLVSKNFHSWWITIPSIIIISREIIIIVLRAWMVNVGKNNCILVSLIGKIKTTIQMLAITILLYTPNNTISMLGITILYISVILTFWSMLQYFCSVRNNLFKR